MSEGQKIFVDTENGINILVIYIKNITKFFCHYNCEIMNLKKSNIDGNIHDYYW